MHINPVTTLGDAHEFGDHINAQHRVFGTGIIGDLPIEEYIGLSAIDDKIIFVHWVRVFAQV